MKLLVATPCFGRMVHMNYVSSLVGLIQGLEMERIPFHTMFLGNESVIQKARNDYLNYAVTSSEAYTHILFIDADMGFEWSDFDLLRKSGKRIISGLCPKKKYPIEYVRGETLAAEGDLDKTDYASIAFCLLDLSVFREHARRVSKYIAHSSITGQPSIMENWFPGGPDRHDEVFYSEDRAFFKLMRRIGEPVWVHNKVLISHSGIQIFKGEGIGEPNAKE